MQLNRLINQIYITDGEKEGVGEQGTLTFSVK